MRHYFARLLTIGSSLTPAPKLTAERTFQPSPRLRQTAVALAEAGEVRSAGPGRSRLRVSRQVRDHQERTPIRPTGPNRGPACRAIWKSAVPTSVLALILSIPNPVEAAAPSIDYAAIRLERRLPAVRAVGSIVIDGLLDERDWTRAPVARGFIQSEPKEGEPAPDDTEVRILYDDSSLYFGVFARDDDPARLITNDLKNDFDRSTSDAFELILDTFHDERNAYHFATNAAGAQWDAQSANEGRDVNADWDGMWTVRTQTVPNGWYAEIAIPFRTLRFPNLDIQTWGVNFLRRVRRRNEDSAWAPLPRIYALNRVSMAGVLEGLRGVRPGRDLRVKPYILGSGSTIDRRETVSDVDVGFDVKYGLTTRFTSDFTVNTDFSQVEADEQQINLTRVSILFPEKRDFFLENAGIFQFGPAPPPPTSGRQNAGGSDIVLFFSRRIGLSAGGATIPLLAGARLTGRDGGFTIGAMNIEQRSGNASPATNFTAVRLRRNVLANSDFGVMFLNKDERGVHFNRVVGADGNFRFFRDLNVNAFAVKTFSSSAGPATVGRDDSARVGMTYRTSFWDLRASYLSVGDAFNDEMGFILRTGIQKTDEYGGVHLRPKSISGWMRDVNPHWHFSDVERTGRGTESRYSDYHVSFSFQDGSSSEAGINDSRDVLFAAVQYQPAPWNCGRPGRVRSPRMVCAGQDERGSARIGERAMGNRDLLRRVQTQLRGRRHGENEVAIHRIVEPGV